MEEEKKDMLKLQGFFIGKEFVKKGTTNGKDWTKYVLLVKSKMEDQYPKRIAMFGGCKGFDDITEGDFISVGYVLSEPYYSDKAKKKIQSKTALWVGKSDETKQESATDNPQIANKPDLSTFDAFKAKYMELVEKAQIKPNAVHMLGSWVSTYESGRMSELITKCKEAIK